MKNKQLNNIDIDGLRAYTQQVTHKPEDAISKYGIVAHWRGGVHSEIHTLNQQLGQTQIQKNFTFDVGEPEELLGNNAYPTPQDYLLGGMAGCMMVGFVANATAQGIRLDDVALTIKGDLNLRGFLGVDPDAPVGFHEIRFHFDITGDGTQEQYNEIIRKVQKLSPNYRTISDAVRVTAVAV